MADLPVGRVAYEPKQEDRDPFGRVVVKMREAREAREEKVRQEVRKKIADALKKAADAIRNKARAARDARRYDEAADLASEAAQARNLAKKIRRGEFG